MEFKFDPKSLHVTETVAFVALGVLTCVLVLFLFLQVRRARRKLIKTRRKPDSGLFVKQAQNEP